jgi:hypothetical protein
MALRWVELLGETPLLNPDGSRIVKIGSGVDRERTLRTSPPAARYFLCLVLTLIFFIKASGQNASATECQEASGKGCRRCHPKLSQLLPPKHFRLQSEELRYCLICHGREGPSVAFHWVVHRDHYSRKSFDGTCLSCHLIQDDGILGIVGADDSKGIVTTEKTIEKMTPYFRSWSNSEHLDCRHSKQSITCELCHGALLPQKRAAMAKCLRCHGEYADLALATEGASAINPHESHLGELKCTRCHKAHSRSVLYCNKCHVYDLQVP